FVAEVVERLDADAAAQPVARGIERALGDDVDRGADAARRNRRTAGLVDLEAADAFGSEVVEVERAARRAAEVDRLVAARRVDERGGDLAAVDGDEVELRPEAANGDLRAFAVHAVDRDARNALQRLGQ